MKKTALATIATLGSLLLCTSVLATTSKDTTGKIQYDSGSLVIDPNPTDPEDPTKPIDPETGDEEEVQPGGNINSRLPKNLNFGYHKKQSIAVEKWLAKNVDTDGKTTFEELATAYEAANQTIGALLVEDNRETVGSWSVKVKQTKEFEVAGSTEDTLGNTVLSITTGALWNNLGHIEGLTVPAKIANKPIAINPDDNEKIVLEAEAGSATGLTKLNLEKFELEIPGNVAKQSAVYTADINWTVSNTP